MTNAERYMYEVAVDGTTTRKLLVAGEKKLVTCHQNLITTRRDERIEPV